MPPTCWDHCLPPIAANSRRTWPAARHADRAVAELSGIPAMLSQLNRKRDVAAISVSDHASGDTGKCRRKFAAIVAGHGAFGAAAVPRLMTWTASAAAAVVLTIGCTDRDSGPFPDISAAADDRCRRCRWPRSGRPLLASTGVAQRPAVGNIHRA